MVCLELLELRRERGGKDRSYKKSREEVMTDSPTLPLNNSESFISSPSEYHFVEPDNRNSGSQPREEATARRDDVHPTSLNHDTPAHDTDVEVLSDTNRQSSDGSHDDNVHNHTQPRKDKEKGPALPPPPAEHIENVEENARICLSEYEVKWDGPNDPMNPRCKSAARKWIIMAVVSWSAFCV